MVLSLNTLQGKDASSDNFPGGERASVCTRIIDVEGLTIGTDTSGQHPVTTVVHVQDDDIVGTDVILDLGLVGWLTNVLQAVSGNGAPDEQSALDVATVGSQEGVQGARVGRLTVDVLAETVQGHGHGAHQTTDATDSGATTESMTAPSAVTLLEQWVVAGAATTATTANLDKVGSDPTVWHRVPSVAATAGGLTSELGALTGRQATDNAMGGAGAGANVETVGSSQRFTVRRHPAKLQKTLSASEFLR